MYLSALNPARGRVTTAVSPHSKCRWEFILGLCCPPCLLFVPGTPAGPPQPLTGQDARKRSQTGLCSMPVFSELGMGPASKSTQKGSLLLAHQAAILSSFAFNLKYRVSPFTVPRRDFSCTRHYLPESLMPKTSLCCFITGTVSPQRCKPSFNYIPWLRILSQVFGHKKSSCF